MHIAVAIPTPEYLHSEFALGNLYDILGHSNKTFSGWNFSVIHQVGVRTDRNRNAILEKVLEAGDVDYILWLDADMLYPKTIIERYFDVINNLKETIDVIGCLYFKRAYPYHPVAYQLSGEEERPYRPVLASEIDSETIYEVDAVGYGGMMVNMKVYKKLGEDKMWTRYGKNFHLPGQAKDKMTHDLVFCKDVKDAGMSVKLHGGVRPGHLMSKVVTIEDWRRYVEEDFDFEKFKPKVQFVMPVTDIEQGKKAADLMQKRAGYPLEIIIVHDDKRRGFMKIANEVFRKTDGSAFGYTAQDALTAPNWLLHAMRKMLATNAGLTGLNDGKWNGSLASFGIVLRSWAKKIYDGDLFNNGYWGGYGDTELTQIAKQQDRYAYADKSVMVEVDFDKGLGITPKMKKDIKKLRMEDKKLYKKRVKNGFNGMVKDKNLLKEFS